MTEEKSPAELDISKLEAVSVRLRYIALTNGLVFQVNDAWPDPAGKPCIEGEIDGTTRHVRIGGIFFVPEKSELIEFEGDNNNETLTTPAHYEVWTEPCVEMRMFRVWHDQVLTEEQIVPTQYAFDTIHARMLDLLTVDPDEIAEDQGEEESPSPESRQLTSEASPS